MNSWIVSLILRCRVFVTSADFWTKALISAGILRIGLHRSRRSSPEVEFDKMKKTQGMDITFVTTAENSKEGKRLLELLGFPFRK